MTPAQIQALENVALTLATIFGGPAVGAGVAAAESVANTFIPGAKPGTVGTVPATAVQPVQADPNAHPVIAASGKAGVVPTPVTVGTHPVDTDGEASYSFPDIYDRLAAVEAKLNALVAATGMAGSAAMAAHP